MLILNCGYDFAAVDHRTRRVNLRLLRFVPDLGIRMPEAIQHQLFLAFLLELGLQLDPKVELP